LSEYLAPAVLVAGTVYPGGLSLPFSIVILNAELGSVFIHLVLDNLLDFCLNVSVEAQFCC